MPKLHLVAIFCEKKSETVAKHRVTRSKITLFRLAIPKMAGFWKKKWNFRVFWGFGAFRPPNSAKLFLGQPHYSLRGKKKWVWKKNLFFFGNKEFWKTALSPLKITPISFFCKKKNLIARPLPRSCRLRRDTAGFAPLDRLHPAGPGAKGPEVHPHYSQTVGFFLVGEGVYYA